MKVAAAAGAIEPLPPALSSMWRLFNWATGRADADGRFVGLSQLSALPDALLALWLWCWAKDCCSQLALCGGGGGLGLGISVAATWFLRTVSNACRAAVPRPE